MKNPYPEKPTGAPVEVVYPREKNVDGKVWLRKGIDSTFLLGNVADPIHAKLTINGHPVTVDSSGGWLVWLKCPSRYDDFVWQIQVETPKDTFRLVLPVERSLPPAVLPLHFFPKPFWVKTNADARFRNSPQGKNILLPMAGTPIKILAQQGTNYSAKLPDGKVIWVDSARVTPIPRPVNPVAIRKIVSTYFPSSRETRITLQLGYPTPYRIHWAGDSSRMEIEFLRCNLATTPQVVLDSVGSVSSIAVKTAKSKSSLWIDFRPNTFLIGYHLFADSADLHIVLREAPPKPVEHSKPLIGWKIVVDPGHGGSEFGAIGPTWLYEKSVNLEVATRLTAFLREAGAMVTQTRVTDTTLALTERVAAAEGSNADLLISVHQNALPDDENPWDSTGSSVYYFHPQAFGLAQVLYRNLIDSLALPERGVYVGDFAICRSHRQLSVLTEATYIIRPDQERKLHDPIFLTKQATAIGHAIVQYVTEHSNRLK